MLSLIGSLSFALIDPRRALGVAFVVVVAYVVVSVIAYRRGMFPLFGSHVPPRAARNAVRGSRT